MNKRTLIIWLPAFLGFVLLLVTQIDIFVADTGLLIEEFRDIWQDVMNGKQVFLD